MTINMEFNIEQSLDGFEILPVDVRRNCVLMKDLDSRVELLKKDVEHLRQEYKKKTNTISREEKCKIYKEFNKKYEQMQAYSEDKIQLANQNLALVNKLIRKADFEYARFKAQLEEKMKTASTSKGTDDTDETVTEEPSAENETVVATASSSGEKELLSPSKIMSNRKAVRKGLRKKSNEKNVTVQLPGKIDDAKMVQKGYNKDEENNFHEEKRTIDTKEEVTRGRGQRRKTDKSNERKIIEKKDTTESPTKVDDMKKQKKGDTNKPITKEETTLNKRAPTTITNRKKSDRIVPKSSDKEKITEKKTVFEEKESVVDKRTRKKNAETGITTFTSDATTSTLQKNIYSSDDIDMPVYPNEPTYCLCNQVSFGKMIGCDNPDCPIEWFHFDCLKLTTKPKGKWYCPRCRVNLKKK